MWPHIHDIRVHIHVEILEQIGKVLKLIHEGTYIHIHVHVRAHIHTTCTYVHDIHS